MARVETIIVGGGIAATLPFTTGAIPYIVSTAPPSISATPIIGFTTGTGGTHPALIVGTAYLDPQPGANEEVRFSGGLISEGQGQADSVVIGRGAVAASTNVVCIGQGATANSTGNIAVGQGASCSGTGGVCVGGGASTSANLSTVVGNVASAAAASTVAIGNGATANGQFGVAVGASSSALSIGAVAVGYGAFAQANGAIAIGQAASVGAFASIAVGYNFTLKAANQIVAIAGGNTPTIGAGATGGSIIFTGGAGVNIAHANVVILGMGLATAAPNTCYLGGPATALSQLVFGQGDTSATTSDTIWRLTNQTGAGNTRGPTLTLACGMGVGNAINGEYIVFQTGASAAAGVQQVSTNRMFVLAGGGVQVNGPDATNLTNNCSMVIAGLGGAGVPIVDFQNTTSGAGASAGTLANAPAVGNPTFWLPVRISGTVRYIPAW